MILMEYDILVIDDEEDIRKLFSLILKKANYSVSTAESGLEGLKLLETNTYQLILIDLKMPGMNGTETLREIRKMDVEIPAYFVTTFHNEYFEELKSLREDGIEFEILNKPIKNDQLITVMNGVILKKISCEKQLIKLRLFITDRTKRTENVINNLHEIFQSELMNEYSLEVISVIDNPILAEQDNILATPTLLRISPDSTRRIIGNFSRRDMVLHHLGLAKP